MSIFKTFNKYVNFTVFQKNTVSISKCYFIKNNNTSDNIRRQAEF